MGCTRCFGTGIAASRLALGNKYYFTTFVVLSNILFILCGMIDKSGIVTIVTENRNRCLSLPKRNTMAICLNCEQEFTPKNRKGKCCSDKCRVAYNRKKKIQPLTGQEISRGIEYSKKMINKIGTEPIKQIIFTDAAGMGKIKEVLTSFTTKNVPERKPYMNDAIKKKLGL